ncbi:MAG: hypothetical protein ACXVZX_04430 [Terriglobales bacterium]
MKHEQLKQLLTYELKFLQLGGYGKPWKGGWRPTMVFRDSPICLRQCMEHDCNACALSEFVPEDKKDCKTPCHHIPLNEKGETIATLYAESTQEQLDEALRHWLEETITRLQTEPEGTENKNSGLKR